MNAISKKIDSLKFQQKLVEEQEALSIYCPNYRKTHILRECPPNSKSDHKCVISLGKHAIEECPSIPGLKETFEGENYEPEPLHTMGTHKN